jgi:hypothetical protein
VPWARAAAEGRAQTNEVASPTAIMFLRSIFASP